jgi:hypothetical protein
MTKKTIIQWMEIVSQFGMNILNLFYFQSFIVRNLFEKNKNKKTIIIINVILVLCLYEPKIIVQLVT